MAKPTQNAIAIVSPLAWSQAIHDREDSARGIATIQLAAIVLIVGRSVLRHKLGLIEASMALSARDVAVIDLL